MKRLVVGAHQAHEPALDFNPVGLKDLRLIRIIFRLEDDFVSGAAESFQCRFLAIDERDDDDAVFGAVAAFDNHSVAIVDSGVDHRIAFDG